MRGAVFTMCFNEHLFLPIWLAHYGRLFGPENCFVIDDGSTDGSSRDARIRNLVTRQRAPLDEDDRAALVSHFHAELLQHYDYVLFTDTDELIVLDPACGPDLREYLAATPFSHKTPAGFDVIHHHRVEPALQLEGRLFAQRGYLRYRTDYCKTLISARPMRWIAGFHGASLPPAPDDNLFLFHLRAVDHEASRRRIRVLNQIRFSENSLQKVHGLHFRWDEATYLAHLYDAAEEDFERARVCDLAAYRREHAADTGEILRIPERFADCIMLSTGMPGEPAVTPPASIGRALLDGMFDTATGRMVREVPGRRRNDPCPCGSGEKLKHCHGALG